MRRLILPLPTVTCLPTASAAAGQDLGGAIGDSLANAPAIPGTNAGKLEAKARLDRARVENNPTLRFDSSYRAGRIDNCGFFGIVAGKVSPFAMQATAEMPIYAGGRISSAIKAESKLLQAKGMQTIAA